MYRTGTRTSPKPLPAITWLEFPKEPKRIVAAVLAAYRNETPSADLAEKATRGRLRDARSS